MGYLSTHGVSISTLTAAWSVRMSAKMVKDAEKHLLLAKRASYRILQIIEVCWALKFQI
jgi:hypothetical protein